jgi:hypothetical protein
MPDQIHSTEADRMFGISSLKFERLPELMALIWGTTDAMRLVRISFKSKKVGSTYPKALFLNFLVSG